MQSVDLAKVVSGAFPKKNLLVRLPVSLPVFPNICVCGPIDKFASHEKCFQTWSKRQPGEEALIKTEMLESNQCMTGLEYWRMAKGQHEIHQTCPAHCLSGPRLLEASCTKFQRSGNRQQSSAGRFADSQSGSRDISGIRPFHCLDSARALRAKSCAGVIEIACSQTTEAVNCRSLHSRRRRGACPLTRRPFRRT